MTKTDINAECRFCLETDSLENLIAPCHCKGSSKYVHNDCLMRWYDVEPARGIRCNTCLTEYDRQDSHTIEFINLPHVFIVIKINYPFLVLLFNFIIILIFNSAKGVLSLFDTKPLYIYYFIVNHIFVFYELSSVIYKVKNKHMYMRMWFTRERISLLFLHCYLLATIPDTYWVGGIAAEYCTCLYFSTHFRILESINCSYTFRFLSR